MQAGARARHAIKGEACRQGRGVQARARSRARMLKAEVRTLQVMKMNTLMEGRAHTGGVCIDYNDWNTKTPSLVKQDKILSQTRQT